MVDDCNNFLRPPDAYGNAGRVAAVKPPSWYLNFRLDILSTEARKAADAVYRRECGLDVRHLRVLRLVGQHPGITFSQLAAETRVERGLTSRIVRALTTRGLVSRTVSTADARQFHLRLTPGGEAVRDRTAPLADRMEELLLSPLSPAERETLSACLEKLTAWVRDGGGLDGLPELHGRGRGKRRKAAP